MLLFLVMLFVLLPMAELYLLLTLGQAIGWIPTLMIALGTGVLGASLARQQGLATLERISRQLSSAQPPGDALVDGAMILLAGAVLITPGVLTDAFGFALLLPPVRAVIKPLLRAAFRRSLQRRTSGGGTVRTWSFGGPPPGPATGHANPGGGEVIEGEVIEGEVIEVRTRDADPH